MNAFASAFLFSLCLLCCCSPNKCIDADVVNSSSFFGGGDGICPAISAFPFWLRRQCPVLDDTRCANAFPSDVPAPPGQLSCALASAQPNARLRQLSARELLAFAKRRDPYGRPLCMLTLFYAPDCVFSAKVADTFFRVAPLLPKLHVVAVDVSVGGKGTESLISHYGISSTPVIALWQDGFPRFRLYDDYARLGALLRVLRRHTDLTPLDTTTSSSNRSSASPPSASSSPAAADEHHHQSANTLIQRAQHQPQQTNANGDESAVLNGSDATNGGDDANGLNVRQQKGRDDGEATPNQEEEAKQRQQQQQPLQQHHRHHPAWWEPTREEFLAQFHYLKEHLGFDWYLFAAVVTCLANCVYFVVSSNKGRALLRRHFPHHFAAAAVVALQ